jgi:hypothetical protein
MQETEPEIRGYGMACWELIIPYLFNIFIDDIIDYISKHNPQAPVIGTITFQDCYLQKI